MSTIFKYKPQLKYLLDDVNTIDNISDKEIKVEESYIRNRGSIALERLGANIARAVNLKQLIDRRLRSVSVACQNRPLDESLNDLILTLTDGDRYLSEGLISYELYKECLDVPFVDAIAKEWERYHIDINGTIEGELYPYLLIIEEDNRLARDAIQKATLNDKTYNSLQDLRQIELLELESLMKKRNDREAAYQEEEIDLPAIKQLQFEIDDQEARQMVYKSAAKIAIKFAEESGVNIGRIEKLLDQQTRDGKNKLYSEQATKLTDKLSIGRKKMSLIVYQGFRAKRESFYAKKQENANLYSKQQKRDAERVFYTNALLYTEIAAPAINQAVNNRITEDMAPGIAILLEGIEDIIRGNEQTMLNFKNTLSASNRIVADHIGDIEDKDKARMMYRSL